jgi:hypothetical protein
VFSAPQDHFNPHKEGKNMAANEKKETRKPDFEIFAVRDGKTEADKSHWMKIGAAWTTEAGYIFPRFDLMPHDPALKIVFKPFTPEDKPAAE